MTTTFRNVALDFVDPRTAESFAQRFACNVVDLQPAPNGWTLVTFRGRTTDIDRLTRAYDAWED